MTKDLFTRTECSTRFGRVLIMNNDGGLLFHVILFIFFLTDTITNVI